MKFRFESDITKQQFLDMDQIYEIGDNPNHTIVDYLDKYGYDEFYLVSVDYQEDKFVIDMEPETPLELESLFYHFSSSDISNFLTMVE